MTEQPAIALCAGHGERGRAAKPRVPILGWWIGLRKPWLRRGRRFNGQVISASDNGICHFVSKFPLSIL